MNSPKRKYRQTKFKSFLFFLLLAIVFWVLTKFSKEYEATVEAKINYRALPQEALLAEDNPTSFTFDLTANGFEFLFYKLNEPTVTLNLNEYYESGQKEIVIDKAELTRLVTSQLEKNVAVKNVSIDGLVVDLNLIEIKKVPLLPSVEISYKSGYKAVDSVMLDPDSISVSGPAKLLEEIDSLVTNTLKLNNIDQSVTGEVAVNFPKNEGVTLKPQVVNYSLEVAEFAQQKIDIPITLINVPEGVNIKLIPKKATLTFSISIEDFNSVSVSDFKMVCNYNERNEDGNFMLPKLVEKPDDILDIELETKKIDFLIFK